MSVGNLIERFLQCTSDINVPFELEINKISRFESENSDWDEFNVYFCRDSKHLNGVVKIVWTKICD